MPTAPGLQLLGLLAPGPLATNCVPSQSVQFAWIRRPVPLPHPGIGTNVLSAPTASFTQHFSLRHLSLERSALILDPYVDEILMRLHLEFWSPYMSIRELERHVDSSRTALGRRRIPRRGNREKDTYNEQSTQQAFCHRFIAPFPCERSSENFVGAANELVLSGCVSRQDREERMRPEYCMAWHAWYLSRMQNIFIELSAISRIQVIVPRWPSAFSVPSVIRFFGLVSLLFVHLEVCVEMRRPRARIGLGIISQDARMYSKRGFLAVCTSWTGWVKL